MDKKALQLLSRFSLPPNALGYCGKNSAPEKFKRCVVEGKCTGVSKEIKNFIVLNPYLKTISKVIGETQLSYNSVEAYWIGNSSLKKFKPEDYDLLLKNFKKQGIPEWIIKEFSEKRPSEFIPTHLFQILNAGVGRTSVKDPYNVDMMNKCMIRWGKVYEIKGEKISVKLNSLSRSKDNYKVKVGKKEIVSTIPGFIRDIKIRDTVAVHWGIAIKKLNSKEIDSISYWTSRILEVFNNRNI